MPIEFMKSKVNKRKRNKINIHKKTSLSINLTPRMIKKGNNLSKRTK